MAKILYKSFAIHTVFEQHSAKPALATFLNDFDALNYAHQIEKGKGITCIIIVTPGTGYNTHV